MVRLWSSGKKKEEILGFDVFFIPCVDASLRLLKKHRKKMGQKNSSELILWAWEGLGRDLRVKLLIFFFSLSLSRDIGGALKTSSHIEAKIDERFLDKKGYNRKFVPVHISTGRKLATVFFARVTHTFFDRFRSNLRNFAASSSGCDKCSCVLHFATMILDQFLKCLGMEIEVQRKH